MMGDYYITLHYITLHDGRSLHYTTLRYITLHYMIGDHHITLMKCKISDHFKMLLRAVSAANQDL